MAQMMDIVARLRAQAAAEGLNPTDEQLIAAAREMYSQSPESRTDGAPDTDIQMDGMPLTPESHMAALGRRSAELASGGPSNPNPGELGWDTEEELLDYRGPGTTDEQMRLRAHNRGARANKAHWQSLGMMHPNQEVGFPDTPEGLDQFLGYERRQQEEDRIQSFRDAGVSMTQVPLPRAPGASPSTPAEFGSVEESQQYSARRPIYNQDGTVTGYFPSQQDKDMYRRGYVYAMGPDGKWGYRVAGGPAMTYAGSMAPGIATSPERWDSDMPGEPGRLGRRPELEAKGWVATPMRGLGGEEVLVYTQGDELRARGEANDREGRLRRLAQRAGVPYEEAKQMELDAIAARQRDPNADPDAAVQQGQDDVFLMLRGMGAEARADDEARRRRAVTNNAMLAGANPGRNLTNAFSMMGDPSGYGLTQNQMRALQYMMPGAQNLAEVEARQLDAAAGMATSALQRTLGPLVSAAAGQAGAPGPVALNDRWRFSEEQRTLLKQAAESYPDASVSSRSQMQADLEAEGMSPGAAQAATDWAFSQQNWW